MDIIVHNYEISPELSAELVQIRQSLESIMATSSQLTQDLKYVKEVLGRVHTESTGTLQKVTELEARLAASGNMTPEDTQLMQDIRSQLQRTDELVTNATPSDPNAPVPAPTPAPAPPPTEPPAPPPTEPPQQ